MSLNKVELLPCYYWTCDSCGLDNFYYPINVDISEQDIEELKLEAGEDVDPTLFKAILIPKIVTCKHCKVSFDIVFNEKDLL